MLSMTVSGLQSMLGVCCVFGLAKELWFNSRKSAWFQLSPNWQKKADCMLLGGMELAVGMKYFAVLFNPLKCSGIRWLHLKLFNAIQV